MPAVAVNAEMNLSWDLDADAAEAAAAVAWCAVLVLPDRRRLRSCITDALGCSWLTCWSLSSSGQLLVSLVSVAIALISM